MTEHQIKGCQILAEVEGWELDQTSTDYCRQNVFRRGDNWKYYYDFYNYLHDWNDLHRVWGIVFDKIRIRREDLCREITESLCDNDKEQTFNALVEAAEWIKQQEK